jgi:2-dehydro-3-deoxygalactonokinase
MTRAAWIAGDWGTSRLRLYLCDAANKVLDTRQGRGAAAARGEHERELDAGIAGWQQDAGPLPVVLCGMVGSTIGWVQAPYLPAPADPQRLAAASVALRAGAVRIVPGVSCRNRLGAPDVMRGEETQILGAMSLEPALQRGAHLLCLPGTHTKWVVIDDGAIGEFLTAPAGEIFDLLSRHSVMVGDAAGERAPDESAFQSALARVRELPQVELLHRVFEVRSRRLLGEMPEAHAASYMSGLLVGSDVAGAARLFAQEAAAGKVFLVGAPELVRAYATALGAFGFGTQVIDGAAASLAGLGAIHGFLQREGMQRVTG